MVVHIIKSVRWSVCNWKAENQVQIFSEAILDTQQFTFSIANVSEACPSVFWDFWKRSITYDPNGSPVNWRWPGYIENIGFCIGLKLLKVLRKLIVNKNKQHLTCEPNMEVVETVIDTGSPKSVMNDGLDNSMMDLHQPDKLRNI